MTTAPLPRPDRLSPQQLMGIGCALCGRYLGASARELGTVRDERFGYPYRLWACRPHCRALAALGRGP